MTATRQIQPTPIRLQPDLKRWLKNEADKNRRSLNGEILLRLEQSQAQQKAKEMGQ